MKQVTKRRVRRVLQFFHLEHVARQLYRRLIDYRLRQRFGEQNEVEIEILGEKVRFSAADLYSKRTFLRLQETSYEGQITKLLAERIRNAHCFVDVGAHIGYYTCIASKLMDSGKVYAFEMDADNLALLKQNIALNQSANVQAIQGAVTNVGGKVEYIKDTVDASMGFGLSSNQSTDGQLGRLVQVDAIVLDQFFGQIGRRPDLFKIDVEGAEMQVLQGMQGLIEQDTPELFVEIHPEKIVAFNTSVDEVVAFLMHYGYTIDEIQKQSTTDSTPTFRRISQGDSLTENNILYAHKP